MKKKLCLLLALAMLLCLLPALAMAEACYVRVVAANGDTISEGSNIFNLSSAGELTIGESDLIIQGVSESCPDRIRGAVREINILAGVNRVTLKDVQLKGTSTVLSADSNVAIKVEGHTVLSTTAQGNTTVEGKGNLTINVGKGAKLEIDGIAKALHVNGDLEIAGAEGEVSIVGKSHFDSYNSEGINGCGIRAEGNITISASNVTIENEDIGGADTDAAEAISTSDGDIIISGSHVTVAGGNAEGDYAHASTAIGTNNGHVIISGSDVTITGGKASTEAASATASGGNAVFADSVTISGTTAIIKGGQANTKDETASGGDAVVASGSSGSVTISGSDARITGGDANSDDGYAYAGSAVAAEGDVTIKGSNATITGGAADGEEYANGGYGVNALFGKITISGSDARITGGTAQGESANGGYGVYADGNIDISGKDAQITGGAAEGTYANSGGGVNAEENIDISGSSVTIQSGDASGDNAQCNAAVLSYNGSITISGSKATITGGAAEGKDTYGGNAIAAGDGDVTISGSDAKIASGSAEGSGDASVVAGILAYAGEVNISGSNVSVETGCVTDGGSCESAIRCKSAIISGSNMYAASNSEDYPAIQTEDDSFILRVPAQESADGRIWTALNMNHPNHTQPYFRTATVAAGGGQSGVPRTGDSANMALWLAMLAGSAAAMCAISGRKRKA